VRADEQVDPSRQDNKGSGQEDGSGDSTITVVVALLANLGVALAKTFVAIITGSASMLAEAAHSWADTGNEVLLLIADKKSRRPPDDTHPFGYGREAYVWSLLAAMGLFFAGAVVSVWHGITQLTGGGEEAPSYLWAYIVLAVSFVFELISFIRGFKQTHQEASKFDKDVFTYALQTSDPTLRAVVAEDSAALIGLVIAAVGIGLHQLTGNAAFDAAGSILIGLVLGVVAVVLINQNRRFLTGQETDDRVRDAALQELCELPEVDRVTYLRLEYVGPRQVLLVASIDLEGEAVESEVATTLRRLEHQLEEQDHITEAVLTLSAPDEGTIGRD
jgi:cation diffusion facilitator family transporter